MDASFHRAALKQIFLPTLVTTHTQPWLVLEIYCSIKYTKGFGKYDLLVNNPHKKTYPLLYFGCFRKSKNIRKNYKIILKEDIL